MMLRLAAATALLFLVLIQPNHPAAMTWAALLLFPLELPVILLAVMAAGDGAAGRLLRGGLAAALTVIAALKLADYVSFTALTRGFNPVADIALVDAFLRLLAGAVGPVLAGAAAVAAVLAAALLAWALWWALAQWARLSWPRGRGAWLALPALALGAVAVGEIGQAMGRWSLPVQPPGAAFTARVGVERVGLARRTLDELRDFKAAAHRDPFAGADGLLDRIDRDVLILFVESYGRASLDTPFHAEIHRATLARYEARLAAAGVAMRSGLLAAPTRGGQSWLSHATVANGLWVDNQASYGAVLASGRETLFHHAARAGFRTAAVMPQITLDWPEALRMGFEDILPAADLGYAGEPFNWVTMPDQFTLAALDRLVREDGDPRRDFVQVALASSHAPWVPIPEILPWDDIGDGTVYNAVATSGDPPEVVWRDRDRVRAQYREAIDYALSAVFEYALLHSDAPPLILVIGDHQAAEFVALDDRPDVPIHVLGPTALVDALAPLAPDPGLLPREGAVRPMTDLRDAILTVYSSGARAARR
ncbi:sulfatase [Jannaschia seohaensis]|uniref:Sulfatase n=1 Tax=Jannaschia seohaensis TaxID=475081 RepID=A0A2Y9A2N4_9RHOB|nr:sulfatase [Jannaschia seohaensis]PWJ22442.1 hypothetical protein BCF38_101856 [Jannaschia seohaensis]SSA38720.1 hypothetical protein SAMN05421539_101856 [Jannaschia seohaensis]